MFQVILMVLVIAFVGNAMATPKQRAESKDAVKRLEPYALAFGAFMIAAWIALWLAGPVD